MGQRVDQRQTDPLRALGAHIDAQQTATLEESGQGQAWLTQAREGALARVHGSAVLHALGQRVAEANDDELALSNTLQQVRGRLLQSRPEPDRRWAWALGGGGALAALALVFVLLGGGGGPTPLRMVAQRVDAQVAAMKANHEREVAAGQWQESADETLRFSDGSTVANVAKGRYRVMAVRPEGADLELAAGRIDVHVVPRDGNRWRVHAGPFVVHVLGTQFDVSWDGKSGRFALALHRGKVRITGPVVDEQVLTAGRQISVNTLGRKVVLETLAASSPVKTGDVVRDDRPAKQQNIAEAARPNSAAGAEARGGPGDRARASALEEASSTGQDEAQGSVTDRDDGERDDVDQANVDQANAPGRIPEVVANAAVVGMKAAQRPRKSHNDNKDDEAMRDGATPAQTARRPRRREIVEETLGDAPRKRRPRRRPSAPTIRAMKTTKRPPVAANGEIPTNAQLRQPKAASRPTVRQETAAAAGPPSPQASVATPAVIQARGGNAPVASPTPKPAMEPPTPWALAAQGKWREAVRAAKLLGWSNVATRATAQQLLSVADAARLSHAGAYTEQAYGLVRSEHPRTSAAAQAAFSLGRVKVRQGRLNQAARWFERYVHERPKGSLVEQARGRALACRAKLPNDNAACSTARAYLREHPKGPRANLALKERHRCATATP